MVARARACFFFGGVWRRKTENPLRVRDFKYSVKQLVLRNEAGEAVGEATTRAQINWRRVKKLYFEVYLFRSAVTANAVK